MERGNAIHGHAMDQHGKTKKGKGIRGSILSILFAFIASSHHWLHTLLIAFGLTSLGASLISMPPAIRTGFMILSLIISFWMLFVAWRKRITNRPAAWVYLISSLISIIVVVTSFSQFTGTPSSVPMSPNATVDHASHHMGN
ncbi:hypothetical protein LSG31_09035 [Fodinisporobacter ferrooxydans]|uniref:Uncharacterized protein n=1 Tax=Fodinisporobacter ferrooxydans TaxID=2901836 RepID=A0ABY4CPA2_9BACL|nr:hypothetical protein LSG31_09035 [Alicyclobacillaceae bacterium MYW30-H2]